LRLGAIAGAILLVVLSVASAYASPQRMPVRTDRLPRIAGGRLVEIPSRRGAVLRPTSRTGRERFTTVSAFGRLETPEGSYGISVQAVHVDDPGFRGTDVFLSFGRGSGSVHGHRQRFAAQDHSYEASASAKAFTWSRDLSRARFDTDGALGRWGRIDLRFVPASARRHSCGGDTSFRTGRLEGRFAFTPRHDNGFFGTVVRTTFRHARLSTSTCHHRFPTGGRGCPTQPTMVDAEVAPDAHSFESFFASTIGDGTVLAGMLEQQFYGPMSVTHEIFAWDDSTVLRDRGGSVRITARAREVGFVGTATATPTGDRVTSDPFPCGDGQQVVFEQTDARVTSGPGRPLTAGFDTGPITLPTAGARGRIVREIVSARS